MEAQLESIAKRLVAGEAIQSNELEPVLAATGLTVADLMWRCRSIYIEQQKK